MKSNGDIKMHFNREDAIYKITETKDGRKMIVCIIDYWVQIPTYVYECLTAGLKYSKIADLNVHNLSVGKAVLSEGDKFDLELGKRIARIKAETIAYKLMYDRIYSLYSNMINEIDRVVFKFKNKTEGVIEANNNYIERTTK